MLIFQPAEDGNYDLANVPDSELKCIATEDINQARFAQVVEVLPSDSARKPIRRQLGHRWPGARRPVLRAQGDRSAFRSKRNKGNTIAVAKAANGFRSAPASLGGQQGVAESETWHQAAKSFTPGSIAEETIRPPLPASTELLLYHFIDGKLFRITARCRPTSSTWSAKPHRYGPVTRETKSRGSSSGKTRWLGVHADGTPRGLGLRTGSQATRQLAFPPSASPPISKRLGTCNARRQAATYSGGEIGPSSRDTAPTPRGSRLKTLPLRPRPLSVNSRGGADCRPLQHLPSRRLPPPQTQSSRQQARRFRRSPDRPINSPS